MNKYCLRCESPIPRRKRYCGDSCKYWYNLIKKEKESGLPPPKKRTGKYFSMVTGYTRAKSGNRQGKRVNGMITGSMSAMITVTTEVWVEVTPENIDRHFNAISFYTPSGIKLGDGRYVKREDIPLLLSEEIT